MSSVNVGGRKLKENSYELGFEIQYMPKKLQKIKNNGYTRCH